MSAQMLFSELSIGPDSYAEVLDWSGSIAETTLDLRTEALSGAEEAIMPPPSKFPAFRRRKACQFPEASTHAYDPKAIICTRQETCEEFEELGSFFMLSCTIVGQGFSSDVEASSQDPSESYGKVVFRREYNKAVGIENDQERRRQLMRIE